MDLYLKYLTDKFKSNGMFRHKHIAFIINNKYPGAGGVLMQGRCENLSDLTGSCELAVNCTGLGARRLCGDSRLVPLRGQVLRVEAPWVKTALYADDVYIIPGQRWVTVGGTRQYNDWMTEVSPHDSARIWARACATFPTIAGAKVLDEVVGLRPHRHTTR